MEMKTLSAVAIALVVIGIVLGIGFLVLEEFEGTLGTNAGAVGNETVTAVSNLSYSCVTNNYTTANLGCYNSFSVALITNASGGEIIDTLTIPNQQLDVSKQ